MKKAQYKLSTPSPDPSRSSLSLIFILLLLIPSAALSQSDKGYRRVPIRPILHRAGDPYEQKARPEHNSVIYNVEDGLPGNKVRTLYQDDLGRMWVGSRESGVSVFDGVEFWNITAADGLCGNGVEDIIQDEEGWIWIAGHRGVTRIKGDSIIKYKRSCPDSLKRPCKELLLKELSYSLLEDRQGRIWIGHIKGATLLEKGKAPRYFAPHDSVSPAPSRTRPIFPSGASSSLCWSIEQGPLGDIWFGTGSKGIVRYDPAEGRGTHIFRKEQAIKDPGIGFREVPHMQQGIIIDIEKDRNENIWISTHKNGLFRYVNGRFINYRKECPKDLKGSCHALYPIDKGWKLHCDKEGKIWTGSFNRGVSCYDGREFKHFGAKGILPGGTVWDIRSDQEGQVWFGMGGQGLMKYNGPAFIYFNRNSGLPNNNVVAIEEGPENGIWFGTDGNGIVRYDGEKFENYSIEQGLPTNEVTALASNGKEELFIACYGSRGGVLSFDGERFRYLLHKKALSPNAEAGGHSYIYSLLWNDEDQSLWIGAKKAVYRYKGDDDSVQKFNIPQADVLSLELDHRGNLLAGTDRKGIFRIDGGNPERIDKAEKLVNGRVTCLHRDAKRNVWVGSEQGLVLLKLDPEAKGPSYRTERIPLLSENGPKKASVRTIQEDSSGNLWIGTKSGMFKIAQGDLGRRERILRYPNKEAFRGKSVRHKASLLDGNGDLWFGMSEQVVRFRPKAFMKEHKVPEVRIHSVELDHREPHWSDKDTLEERGIHLKGQKGWNSIPVGLSLPYDHDYLTLRFRAMTLDRLSIIRYQYRLKGERNEWSDPIEEGKVSFSSLEPGKYELQVRAMNQWGDRGKRTSSFAFTVRPPWWQTWWFRSGAGILLIGLVGGSIKYREYRLRKSKELLEAQVAERTQELREKNDSLEKAYELIRDQKEEITDSIDYAKRIQDALLPSEEHLEKGLGEHFVLYRPCHLVSGDLYWCSIPEKDRVIWATVDCTGHGVPGAFMSMIGNSLLNELIAEGGMRDPAAILRTLRQKMIGTLLADPRAEAMRDGMDMSLCSWDKKENILRFAGAVHSIFILRESFTKAELDGMAPVHRLTDGFLVEIKGDKKHIGYQAEETAEDFTLREIQLKPGDRIYTFTDGYPDQLGGPYGKKFMLERFRRKLLEIRDQPMDQQKEELERTLYEWMQESNDPQVDDICVIGVKVP